MKKLIYFTGIVSSAIATMVMYRELFEFMNSYEPANIGIWAGWLVLASITIVFFVMIMANFEALWEEF